ncbi:hypothetical protein C0Q70_06356 [Pomacea canaliculata]|uniref:ELMO domain-containing protein n=2 Tax=Pomacea canaliculata TaxID=400727 RepID=A0A2T7PNS5_POMCA|nr:ELMO domain-containing protein 2-like isoform X2 [Pomacea canaliculata]XP_025085356.1 ELMO domain-containing protein 2-like isoform X2 [Pomacea canaliculata]PVD35075.1 hypothetical protein C0Q70_06356 [Pomacea canaliculata]
MWKWLLHKVSGKCELLRITYEEQPGVKQTKRIEESLKCSKSALLKEISTGDKYNVDEAVEKVMGEKKIVREVHAGFEGHFRRCLLYIRSYNQLTQQVESLRRSKFSVDDPDHEQKLLKLWRLLMPQTQLTARVSHQWGDIGFQGTDPQTDFRGMGILGLHQLVYFAEKYNNEARNVLLKANNPKNGFSYAIVSINITDLQHRLMMKRKLRTHFYNLSKTSLTVDDYHEVHCYLMSEFTHFWFSENPADVMEFNRIRDKFKRKVILLLKDPQTQLVANFQR